MGQEFGFPCVCRLYAIHSMPLSILKSDRLASQVEEPPPHWVVDKRQALNGILSPVSVHILWVWMASLACDWLMTKAFLAHDTCGM